jgi:hypothetical protein
MTPRSKNRMAPVLSSVVSDGIRASASRAWIARAKVSLLGKAASASMTIASIDLSPSPGDRLSPAGGLSVEPIAP